MTTPQTEAGPNDNCAACFQQGWIAGEVYGRSEAAAQARTEALDVDALRFAFEHLKYRDHAWTSWCDGCQNIDREYAAILAAKADR